MQWNTKPCIYDASLKTPVSQAPDISKRIRTQLFVLIQSKLPPKIFARTAKIPMGNVEKLIRNVRDMHYNSTMASEFSYREKLSRASLDNHDDIDELISFVEEQIKEIYYLQLVQPPLKKRSFSTSLKHFPETMIQ